MAISNDDLEYFLNMKYDDMCRSFMLNNFAKRAIKDEKSGKMKFERKFDPSEPITIPKGRYHNNPSPIQTNIGLLVLNKFLFEEFYDILGYVNDELTSGKISDIHDVLDKSLLNDRITTKQHIRYLNDLQWFGFSFNSIIVPSMTSATTKPLEAVRKEKQKLVQQSKDKLDRGDAIEAAKIEAKLIEIAKREIGNDPGMELYDSGSKASFGNNYKAMFIMKGPMVDNSTGAYSISKSNFMEGVKKDEIHVYADSIVTGAHAKGIQTQVGGYLTKKYMSAYQSLVLDKKGSDCKSSMYHVVTINDYNYKLFMDRYIIENGKLVNLDDSTIKKYIGRTVKMRDPIYCTSDRICNKCAGDLYYKLGIENIGLTSTKITSSLMQKSLKKFHDTSVKLYKVNIDDLVS